MPQKLIACRYFGGKSRLWKHLEPVMPNGLTGNYYEPFVGGCSIVLQLLSEGRIRSGFVSDVDLPLIDYLIYLTCAPDELSDECAELEWLPNTAANYAMVCSKLSSHTLAARYAYVKARGFRGVIRYEIDGESVQFTTPWGKGVERYSIVRDYARLSNLMRGVNIRCADYEDALQCPRSGDFVYIDPPYHTKSRPYENQFTLEDHARLAHLARECRERGATVVASNSDLPVIRDIWGSTWSYLSVPHKYTSCKGHASKPDELIIY